MGGSTAWSSGSMGGSTAWSSAWWWWSSGSMVSIVEQRLDGLDRRVIGVERDVFLIKWMIGFILVLQVSTFYLLWQVMLRLPG
jgi:hypothetical protein